MEPHCLKCTVPEQVRAGGHLEAPQSPYCSVLSDIMTRCWSYEPELRPTFAEALEVIEEEMAKNKVSNLSHDNTVRLPKWMLMGSSIEIL